MKKISILVPCCNVEKYIRECLESIKAQTYPHLEVICIDDGSTDSTGAIIDEYVAADSRFQVIHKPNTGYGDSMNQGLETCTGDYIGIVESDDWIEPDMYERLLDQCQQNDLDLIHCLWQSGPTGTEETDPQSWIKQNAVYAPLDIQEIFYMQPSIWAALYRRDLLEDGRKVRFLPTPGASYQDASFAFKAYTKSKRFMLLGEALHHYRINPASSVSSSGKVYCILDEWKEMKRWINESPALKEKVTQTHLFPIILHGGLIWNYQRLATVAKLKFLRAASHFLRETKEDGLMNLYGYESKPEGLNLLQVMTDPLAFHRRKSMEIADSLYAGCEPDVPNTNKTLISVIVSCYNTAQYIQSSLESICRQNYRNLEIICVDDCSTDETALLVRHFMRKEPRMTFICTDKNSGLSVSRNLGLKNCNGKYVMFVDGDDCLMPGAINRLYAEMHDGVDAVMGSTKVDYEGGRAAYGWLPESDDKYYTIPKDMLVDIKETPNLLLDFNVSAWGKLWRRSILERYEIRFPEGLLYEDANFFWKYLCAASKISLLKAPVYYYLRHQTGSIMSSTFNKKPGYAIQHLYILEDLYKYIHSRNFEKIGHSILSMIYEPYFWFAYNHSPESDHDEVFSTMCRILKEQSADVSHNPLLQYIGHYEDVSKSKLFMEVYHAKHTPKKKSLWKKLTDKFKH